jgi:hypothetical protein
MQWPVVHLKGTKSDVLVRSTFQFISEKSSLLRTFRIQTLHMQNEKSAPLTATN